MYVKTVLLFLCFSLMQYIRAKNFAVGSIEEINTFTKYYPHHYCSVPNWLRRKFKIKKKVAPKIFVWQLWISLFYLVLIPVNALILVLSFSKLIEIQVAFQLATTLLEIIVSIIASFMYDKRNK